MRIAHDILHNRQQWVISVTRFFNFNTHQGLCKNPNYMMSQESIGSQYR